MLVCVCVCVRVRLCSLQQICFQKYVFHAYMIILPDSLRLNTPVVQIVSAMDNELIPGISDEKFALRDIDDAIAVATSDLGLMPGVAFQGRVSQLAQLNIVHKTVSYVNLSTV